MSDVRGVSAKPLIAGILVGLLVALGACGSDDGGSKSPTVAPTLSGTSGVTSPTVDPVLARLNDADTCGLILRYSSAHPTDWYRWIDGLVDDLSPEGERLALEYLATSGRPSLQLPDLDSKVRSAYDALPKGGDTAGTREALEAWCWSQGAVN